MNLETKAKLDPLARKLGFYTAYELDEREYIGRIDKRLSYVTGYLEQRGYETSPTLFGISLEAAKYHPETGDVHDASYRKVDSDNPHKQYHIHLWQGDGDTEIYSHYEYRPDVALVADELPSDAYDRLMTHYRPSYADGEYKMGVACDVVKERI